MRVRLSCRIHSKRKHLSLLFFISCLFIIISTNAQKARKTVFIIVDGVAADVIEKLPVPNLKAIAKVGGYTRAYVGGVKGTYSETPTISAVGYNSVLTGTWVNKHNVWDNDIADPNYHYYTIFRLLKEQYPNKKTAIFSSWLDNRTKLVGDNFKPTGNIPLDYHYDGLELDTLHFPHDSQREFMSNIDESVAKNASDYIKTNAPDLSWVYLEYTDDMGHMYGDSPQFHKAIELADKRVGYIWEAIKYRQQHFNEDWLIIITTDHGRDAKTGKGHGGQSDRERSGWIFTNAEKLNEEFGQPQASIVDIMPTIARFMNISIEKNRAFEVDGIPFSGTISFIKPIFHLSGNTLTANWKAVQNSGDMKVWLATTNHFKTGGKDEYTLLGTVPVNKQQASFDLSDKPSGFYKVVLQAPHNTNNHWIGKSQ